MPNSLSDKETNKLFQVLNKHLGETSKIQIILFGSMAQGKERPTSDIDIAIKGANPLDKATWAKIEGEFEDSDLKRKVDVVDYHRVDPAFQKIIDKQGQLLWATRAHPYRLCPSGFHWVSEHLRKVTPSKSNPIGGLAHVDGHCRKNRGRGGTYKEVFSVHELHEIFHRFGKLKNYTVPKSKNAKWNRFDHEIGFWTDFWNQVFKPESLLSPIEVKALIASESSFNISPKPQNAGKAGTARGLIQLADQSISALGGKKNEVKDFRIKLTKKDLSDPNIVIASGIRWLFHKKNLAASRLKRNPTWREAIIAYKGYLKTYIDNPKSNLKGMNTYDQELGDLTSK